MVEAINAGVASTTEMVTDVLVANLPLVMGIFGGLIALGIAFRLIKRGIGRRV
jgi:hypothetical protein